MSFLFKLGLQHSSTPKSSPRSTIDGPTQQLSTFCDHQGVKSRGILSTNPLTGVRGIFCSPDESVSKGSGLFTVPYSLAITQDRAAQLCSTPGVHSLPDWSAIACLLLETKYDATGTAFYRPYVDSLPSASNSILEWTPAEQALFLRSTSAAPKAQRILRAYADSIDQLRPLLPSASEDDFRWAFSMLLSRLVRLQGRGTQGVQALVPWADMLNHSASAKGSYIDLSTSDPDLITAVATRDFSPGSELVISYGDKSSAEFLMSYGFVPSDGITEAAHISLSLQRDDPQLDLKARVLRRVDMDPADALFPLRMDAQPLGMLGYAALSISRVESEQEAIALLSEKGMPEEMRARAARVVLNVVRSASAAPPSASTPAPTSLERDPAASKIASNTQAAGGRGKRSRAAALEGSPTGDRAADGQRGHGQGVRPELAATMAAVAAAERKILERWDYLLSSSLRGVPRAPRG